MPMEMENVPSPSASAASVASTAPATYSSQPAKISRGRLVAVTLAVIIYTCLATVKSTLYFPFCRTLVVCGKNYSSTTCPMNVSKDNSGGGHDSRDWSGSDFCGDRCAVADAAQVLKSFGDVFNIVCQILFMPLLGAVSDVHGRRNFLVLGAFGLFVQIVLCGLAARDVFPAAETDTEPYVGIGPAFLLIVSSMIQGGTSTFLATVVSMVADVYPSSSGSGRRNNPNIENDDHKTIHMNPVTGGSQVEGNMPETKLQMFSDPNELENVELMQEERPLVQTGKSKALEKAMGILQGVKALGTVAGTIVGVLLISHNYADYADKFIALSVLGFVMVILSVYAPETLVKSPTQLNENLISHDSTHEKNSDAHGLSHGTLNSSPMSMSKAEGDNGHPSNTILSAASTKISKFCGLSRGPFAHIDLILEDRVLRSIALYAIFFAFGGACLSTISAYTVSDLNWTQTESTFALVGGGCIGLISLCASSCIVPRFGSLLSMVLSSAIATTGLLVMCLSPLSSYFFVAGFAFLCSGSFGIVAYLSFVSMRVDPDRQGEMQGAIGACGLVGFVIGQFMFSQLFVYLENGTKWIVLLIGAFISSIACLLVLRIWKSNKWSLGRSQSVNV